MEITIGGRNVLTTYHHLIMKADLNKIKAGNEYPYLHIERVTEENLFKLEGAYFSTNPMKRMLLDSKSLFEGYALCNSFGKCLSYVWIAYKGADQRHYRIRNINCFLFKISTMPEYRGKGYCPFLLQQIALVLKEKGIHNVYLAVMKNNKSAIRAYEKSGFYSVGRRIFVRFLRYNIPYHRL